MTGWVDARWCAWDVESTGVDVFQDRIVTACVAHLGADATTAVRSWMLNPGIPIQPGATAVHGITDERAQAEGQDPAAVVDVIAGELCMAWSLGMPVIAFNASFDFSMLAAELVRYGLPSMEDRLGRPIGPVLDPYVIDGHLSYRKGSRKLVDQCSHYRVAIDGAHDSTHDAIAAARVMWRIASTTPKIAARTLEQLHADQVGWAAARAESFRAYLTRQGKPCDDVSGDWPVQALPAAVAS